METPHTDHPQTTVGLGSTVSLGSVNLWATPRTDAAIKEGYHATVRESMNMERENARLRYALKELVEQCRTGDDITAWWRAAVDRAEQALIALPNGDSQPAERTEPHTHL